MDSQHHCLAGNPLKCAVIAVAIAIVFASAVAIADGARIAVKANPSEIILTRNVATRIAYRQPVSPGMALLSNPMPNQQIDSALGLGNNELSDADVVALSATPQSGNSTVIGNTVNNALANSEGSHVGGHALQGVNGVSSTKNMAAGSGNLQANTLSMAATTK